MRRTIRQRAFTLVEMLLVIAIISILAAMAISNFSNASQDSRDIIARQQLAVVQEMNAYNTATGAARYALFSNYLDEATRGSLTYDTGTGRLTTQAMRDTGRYLTLPNWAAGSFPKVQFN
jgi:prepilin-type N-terminal cleavage/methylation domain-containing protein